MIPLSLSSNVVGSVKSMYQVTNPLDKHMVRKVLNLDNTHPISFAHYVPANYISIWLQKKSYFMIARGIGSYCISTNDY